MKTKQEQEEINDLVSKTFDLYSEHKAIAAETLMWILAVIAINNKVPRDQFVRRVGEAFDLVARLSRSRGRG